METMFSPAEFAAKLTKIALEEDAIIQIALKRSLELVEKTAIDEFGVYQPEVGPFPAWAELADSTKKQRLSQGYTENDPLLRSGKLRDTISYEVGALEGVVGSDDEVMLFHEGGTVRFAARPVLGPALFRNVEKIQEIFALAAFMAMKKYA